MVFGDVNSTIAAALVASKLRIKVAHVEAGARGRGTGRMPEEINRVVTDAAGRPAVHPSSDANENLPPREFRRTGGLVGNIMVDSLLHRLPQVPQASILREHGVEPRGTCW